MRKALIVGIDDYPQAPLSGCVNDANAIATLLSTNGDGSPNFSIRSLTSNNKNVTRSVIQDAVSDLFSGDAETAVFYFAGHGFINLETNAGYIVTEDGERGAWGFALSELLQIANKAYPRIRSSVIILDCCHAGFAGEVSGLGSDGQVSVIGNGVTILTACQRQETAGEVNGQGVFTSILIDGLQGSSADICGKITPASVYSHVDQTLGPWEQRPVYKANVQSFVVLRQVDPKIPLDVLRRLPTLFPDPSHMFALDPSFEPDRGEEHEKLKNIPVDPDNERTYRDLQRCYRHGLVLPVDQPHMWHAAVHSTGCRLTALGAHYRNLAKMGRI
ncbi:caspase family protein [Thalassobaculum sp. OXR-137]|uniref:caspase family protein n=1 Tax=Thalassobaculum sp. OXR-137 TaxID=3100173 RepID=UPI002AC9863C|nr:caspase family protein [Thalassobaculum sp. OXR-137]WPZ34528.1 caspase family protein [Thalassobaculum sp. OXR-137]